MFSVAQRCEQQRAVHMLMCCCCSHPAYTPRCALRGSRRTSVATQPRAPPLLRSRRIL